MWKVKLGKVDRTAASKSTSQPGRNFSQHPPGDLQRGPRELVALHEVETAQEVVDRADLLADDPGGQVLAHGVEGGQRVLGGVARDVRRAALTPRVMSPALQTHQHRVGVVPVAVRGLPRERERDFTQ